MRKGKRLRVLLVSVISACAPVAPAPVVLAPSPQDGGLMAFVPAPVLSLLAIDLLHLRGSPWAKNVLESAAPAAGRQSRGFDEIADVDRWVFARVSAPGSGIAVLELGRGRFDRDRVEASFRTRHPSAQEHRFGPARGLADSEAAIAFPKDDLLALGPVWAVEAALRTGARRADAALGSIPERWLAEATAAVEQEAGAGRAAVEMWLRLDDTTRAELTAVLGSAEGIDWVGGRLALANEARAVLVAATRAKVEAIGLAAQLGDQLSALQSRRSVQALGLAPVLERALVSARDARVVVDLRVSEGERDTVSDRLAALAAVLARSRAEPKTEAGP